MPINPRTYEQAAPAVNKDPSYPLLSEISGVFSHLSAHDRKSRKREKIRQELVRVQFETSPAAGSSVRSGFVSQLGKLLKLD